MSKDIIQEEYETYLVMYEKKLLDNNAKTSLNNRKSVIRKFFRYLCGFNDKPAFEDIKRVNIQSFLRMCEEKEELAPNTLRRYFSFFKEFFGFCQNKGFNTNNIFNNWDYNDFDDDTKKVYLTDEQIIELRKIIDSYDKSEKSFRAEICFLLLTYTGCYKDELCSLNIYKNSESMKMCSDEVLNYILLDEKEIYFGKKGNKYMKIRMIPLNDYVIEKLKEYMKYLTTLHGIDFEQFPFLFPSHYDQNENNFRKMNPSQINTGFKELINSCELIKVRGSLFQMFRNTFVKNMINDGVPVQIIQELSGLNMTSLNGYTDIEKYERELKEKVLKDNHPYKVLYN
jgi:site-specific recombinase XerD